MARVLALMTLVMAMVMMLMVMPPVDAHATHYPEVGSDVCNNVAKVRFFSYHIHVLYWGSNSSMVERAMGLRARFLTTFNVSDECPGLFHNEVNCWFAPAKEADGPFLTGQWAVYMSNQDPAVFFAWTSWIMKHREDFDVLIHPNSGCMVHDHVDWCVWGGTRWELDTSALHSNMPWRR